MSSNIANALVLLAPAGAAPVFPNLLARCGIEGGHIRTRRPAGWSRIHDIHHAVVDERNTFLATGRHVLGPGEFQLGDVGFLDLIERTKTLGVIGSAEHQPVVRLGFSSIWVVTGVKRRV
jgi:hypothetical protein